MFPENRKGWLLFSLHGGRRIARTSWRELVLAAQARSPKDKIERNAIGSGFIFELFDSVLRMNWNDRRYIFLFINNRIGNKYESLRELQNSSNFKPEIKLTNYMHAMRLAQWWNCVIQLVFELSLWCLGFPVARFRTTHSEYFIVKQSTLEYSPFGNFSFISIVDTHWYPIKGKCFVNSMSMYAFRMS